MQLLCKAVPVLNHLNGLFLHGPIFDCLKSTVCLSVLLSCCVSTSASAKRSSHFLGCFVVTIPVAARRRMQPQTAAFKAHLALNKTSFLCITGVKQRLRNERGKMGWEMSVKGTMRCPF